MNACDLYHIRVTCMPSCVNAVRSLDQVTEASLLGAIRIPAGGPLSEKSIAAVKPVYPSQRLTSAWVVLFEVP